MFCIVGGGLSGDTAAATLREEGYGGPIMLIGDEAEAPYDRPPLSKDALLTELPTDRLKLRPASWYEEQSIELRLGLPVAGVDARAGRLRLMSGEEVAYDRLLIATGARARSLPAPDGLPMFVVRTLDDARNLRSALLAKPRVAIVGAGVIGLEVAAAAARLGCTVDVVDLADRVMTRVAPPAYSAFMADLHCREGVRLHLSAGAVDITSTGLLTAAHGPIRADIVVVGIGVAPNSELAATAGLECADGIVVDAHARTSDPSIFAVGDVARYPDPFGEGMRRCENWRHAIAHATLAARNMLGQDRRYGTASSMWSDQYEVKLQTVGRLSGESVDRGRFGDRKFMTFYRDAAGVVVGAVGVNSPKDMKHAQMLIERGAALAASSLADTSQDLRKMAA